MLSTSSARPATSQVWPSFVLVAGLLLVGLACEEDGLFRAAGGVIARRARGGVTLFVWCGLLVGVVTALLNLDTSVAFVTPVLVYCARARGEGERPLLVASILLANAGSLTLPGANLTNLIVLSTSHVTGARYLSSMYLAGPAALVVTGLVIVVVFRRELTTSPHDVDPVQTPRWGLGIVALVVVTLAVLIMRAPALVVAAVGLATALSRSSTRARMGEVLGVPVLVALFGVSTFLGTIGRMWSGPATALAHLDAPLTAGVAAVATVLVNNLPAAALLASHAPPHPFALLIGLNVGPNLFVTGSLAWVLWRRSAMMVGAQPSLGHATRVGVVSAPFAITASLLGLWLAGGR